MSEAATDPVRESHGNPTTVSDPASDLVDPDPNHDTPASPSPAVEEPEDKGPQIVFSYAGANAGGQSMHVCMGLDGCGSLLLEEFQGKHLNWHVAGRP